jgi:sec-independent protein translocase protein TatA
MANLTGWHLVILLGVVVLLFGAKKLPEAARSVGQAARVLKGELRGMHDDEAGIKPPADQPANRPASETDGRKTQD